MGFADARERRSIIGLLKYRRACPSIAKAEIVMRLVPNWLFLLILNMIKEAKIASYPNRDLFRRALIFVEATEKTLFD